MPAGNAENDNRTIPSALERRGEIAGMLKGKRAVVFLDYDGTLTPIVDRPEDAVLSEEMRDRLCELARRCTVAIVSGRDLADVRGFVRLDELIYAGSHGFDIRGPDGLAMQLEEGKAALPDLDRAEEELSRRLEAISGARVERKKFAIAIHYRLAAEDAVAQIERIVDEVKREHPRLRKRGGKKIFELQPDIEWDKGRAVLWLLEALGFGGPDVLPFYIGDDLTDEDAFRALTGRGVSVMVGDDSQPTNATYRLKDTDEVRRHLQDLTELIEHG